MAPVAFSISTGDYGGVITVAPRSASPLPSLPLSRPPLRPRQASRLARRKLDQICGVGSCLARANLLIAAPPKIAAAREASGCEALLREADALSERGEDLDEQVESTVATSFAGVLAQLEVLRESFGDHALLETIITGIKRLAGSAAGSHG
jgi:hypothetical protein